MFPSCLNLFQMHGMLVFKSLSDVWYAAGFAVARAAAEQSRGIPQELPQNLAQDHFGSSPLLQNALCISWCGIVPGIVVG